MSLDSKIWLVGSGSIAIDYAKVLTKLKKSFIIIGRGRKSAKIFSSLTNLKVHTGGINKILKKKLHLK